jgi:hypothetical protein
MVRATRTAEDAIFERRYRRKRRRGRSNSIVGIRVRDIESMFHDKYGAQLPDDDAGRDDLFVLLNHCAYYADAKPRMLTIAASWAPWLYADALEDMIADITARPLRWRADKLAQRLGLDDATRTRLGITTIGAIDVTAEQRKARRRERDRLAQEAKRRAAGIRPRPKRRRETLAGRAPWKAQGISRSAWFRRRQRDNATVASAA